MSMVFKVSYKPPPLEVLNQLTQLPPIPLPISPPNLTITRRLIFPSILSTSFAPTSSPTTFVIKTTSIKPTWNQLSIKIREQFNIPANIDFSLTYLGTGGNEMNLSSQDELINYFSQDKDALPTSKKNISYKFGLTIFFQNNNVEEDKKGEENDKEFEKMNYHIEDGQLDVLVYDDEYYNYDYNEDEEYLHSRYGCSQQ
ncbi:12704_t:CDS:1 [Funneliformis geosporum]|uniref:6699_t:CDS:1 n=1 Tax=Funneliformis geosporum TaxID=1117311 RepID=A0A9W4SGM3_9GLOM|nr:12704_t:CDS:1 [Funneliformis geosporum]CAI2168193.1 6699_t:CDS:1 [Funneliformis geosporum]